MKLTFRPGSPTVIFDRGKRPKEEGKHRAIVPIKSRRSPRTLSRLLGHRVLRYNFIFVLMGNPSTEQSRGGRCQNLKGVSSRHHRFGDAHWQSTIHLPSNHVGHSQILRAGRNWRLESKDPGRPFFFRVAGAKVSSLIRDRA